MFEKKFYNRDGKEISQEEWAELKNDYDYAKIGHFETLANGEKIRVSTVWLGINYNLNLDGDPVLFETMVFGGRNNGLMRRYSTELEALLGHSEIVDIVQDTLY